MTPQEAAKIIWEGRKNNTHCPPVLHGRFSMEEGYRVQMELLALELQSGERQTGWKVGLTAKAIQQQVGVHERVFGHLLESSELPSGTVLKSPDLIQPHFENELCVILGESLRGPGVTIAQARTAISGVAPAVEVVEHRGDTGGDLPLALADNAEQKFFITGPVTSPLPPGLELVETGLEIWIDGVLVEKAGGHEVMEGPEGSVAWLANRLAEFGRTLEAGNKVITGSFTRQYPGVAGQRYEARFTPFGSVIIQME